jgi:hypothetical protein
MAHIGVIIGQLLRLSRDGIGNFRAAIADVDAIEAGESVEQPRAVAVCDVYALSTRDDAVAQFSACKLTEMG